MGATQLAVQRVAAPAKPWDQIITAFLRTGGWGTNGTEGLGLWTSVTVVGEAVSTSADTTHVFTCWQLSGLKRRFCHAIPHLWPSWASGDEVCWANGKWNMNIPSGNGPWSASPGTGATAVLKWQEVSVVVGLLGSGRGWGLRETHRAVLQTETKLNHGSCSLPLFARVRLSYQTSAGCGNTGSLLTLAFPHTLPRPLKEAIHTHVILLLFLITLHTHSLQTIEEGHPWGWRSRPVSWLKPASWVTGGARGVCDQSVATGISHCWFGVVFTRGLCRQLELKISTNATRERIVTFIYGYKENRSHFRSVPPHRERSCVTDLSQCLSVLTRGPRLLPRFFLPLLLQLDRLLSELTHLTLLLCAQLREKWKLHLNITMSYPKRSTLGDTKGQNWTQTWKSGSWSLTAFCQLMFWEKNSNWVNRKKAQWSLCRGMQELMFMSH